MGDRVLPVSEKSKKKKGHGHASIYLYIYIQISDDIYFFRDFRDFQTIYIYIGIGGEAPRTFLPEKSAPPIFLYLLLNL